MLVLVLTASPTMAYAAGDATTESAPTVMTHEAWSDSTWGNAAADWDGVAWGDDADVAPAVEVHGFVEAAVGVRVVDNPTQSGELSLGESRLRLELAHRRDRARLSAKLDTVGDGVTRDWVLDLREARIWWAAGDHVEVSVGRQMLTWGTGDLLFLNDLFPKDYESFFAGRADEFLKAPVDAAKLSAFAAGWSFEVVWMPWFTPDRIVDGRRLSYFHPLSGVVVGEAAPLDPVLPAQRLRNGEFAARVAGTLASVELAAYGYQGFSKQPLAVEGQSGNFTYARQAVAGASLRTPLVGGLANVEAAYTHSFADPRGDRALKPNSQFKALAGYERELWARLTLGLQYMLEATLQHDRLLATSPPVAWLPDAQRHTLTTRVGWRSVDERWRIGLFAFVVPSDADAYLRPTLGFVPSDGLGIDVGGNVMLGRDRFTLFGQLADDSNVYTRIRYSF